MPNPWGTALQVLAGAFGEGASSLGKSRLDQSRIDTTQDRQDERYRIEDEQWGKAHDLEVRQAKTRQSALDLQREETRLGRESQAAMLAERGFPSEVIQAILYGRASVATYLGPDGMYAGPGMRRGVTPPRATTPAPSSSPTPPRFPSNGANPAGAPPPTKPARRPPPVLP